MDPYDEQSAEEAFLRVKQVLLENDQQHVLEAIPGISADHPIVKQLSRLDVPSTLTHFRRALTFNPIDIAAEPFSPIIDWTTVDDTTKVEVEDLGKRAIQNNSVGAIILSGGQGTRLGYDGPKGKYDIGLPSHKSIFEIHIERIRKIRELCRREDGSLPNVPIYIMTSDLNHRIIVDFFHQNDFFGYPEEDIFFFEQALELCLSTDGKIIIESPTSLALAPDGNGGIFSALKTTGALSDMVRRGIQHLHVYGIDNVLTKSLDPAFIGLCIRDKVDCANKVVERLNKDKKVGVTVLRNNKMFVAEYSELPQDIASAVDASGKLIFNAANICNHYFSVQFLNEKLLPDIFSMYHLASKRIPFLDTDGKTIVPTSNNGYKLEMFIFDVFPSAERFTVMSVSREDEFAPVKNSPGAAADSPVTARAMMSRQAFRWLNAVGAIVHWTREDGSIVSSDSKEFRDAVNSGELQCEIAAMLSYGGEGLGAYAGEVVNLPCYLTAENTNKKVL